MSVTIRHSIDLPAPSQEVFGFVACTDNYPRDIPAYESGRVLAGTEGQPGMTFRWRTACSACRCQPKRPSSSVAKGSASPTAGG